MRTALGEQTSLTRHLRHSSCPYPPLRLNLSEEMVFRLSKVSHPKPTNEDSLWYEGLLLFRFDDIHTIVIGLIQERSSRLEIGLVLLKSYLWGFSS